MRLDGAIFVCDQTGCNNRQAVAGEELTDQYLRLVQDHDWSVIPAVTSNPHRRHYCPEHKGTKS